MSRLDCREFVFALAKAQDFPRPPLRHGVAGPGSAAWRRYLAGASLFGVGEAQHAPDERRESPEVRHERT